MFLLLAIEGEGTSSSTQPSLMAHMLHALDLTGSERVLEVGTGTGYNAALLSHRLGNDRLTTIEVGPHVTELARERLSVSGYEPDVRCGDGAAGWADAAPYDRVIATVSFPHVPRAWIDQTRDGGLIVTSLCPGRLFIGLSSSSFRSGDGYVRNRRG